MPLFVFTGTDAGALRERQRLLAAAFAPGNVVRFELRDDHGHHLALAATTPSLFLGERLLLAEPVAELAPEHAARLADGVADGVTVVLTGVPAPSAALRRALPDATYETFAVPTARDAAQRVAAAALTAGVSLDHSAVELLVGLAPSQWDRVRGALEQLAALGVTHACARDVRPLVGTARAQAVPWVLADAIVAGDLPAALRVARALEPIPTIAYLAKRASALGFAAEQAAVVDARTAALARRLGTAGVSSTWDLLAAADRDVKLSADPAATLDVLVMRLARLWAPLS